MLTQNSFGSSKMLFKKDFESKNLVVIVEPILDKYCQDKCHLDECLRAVVLSRVIGAK